MSQCQFRRHDDGLIFIFVFIILVNTCGAPNKQQIREIVREECLAEVTND